MKGVPPLVSRRVLETLTYLARNHPYVAKILLQFKVPQPRLHESENVDKARSKAVMIVEEDMIERNNNQEGSFSIALLMNLLSQPLYLRSIAHLEQVMIYSLYFDVLISFLYPNIFFGSCFSY